MASANTASEEKNIWKVVRVAGENRDVNSLFLEGKDEKFTARKAGQFVSIRVPAAEAGANRTLSPFPPPRRITSCA